MSKTLVQIRNVKKYFPVRRGFLSFGQGPTSKAVDGIDIDVPEHTTIGLAGESGSGKTTVGRLALRLYEPDDGQVLFRGINIAGLTARDMRRLRPEMQMVFQNPFASLNPRRTVRQIVADPVKIHKGYRKDELKNVVQNLLAEVELEPELFMNRYPHELSGGQRQRVAIARAIATRPKFIVADEAVSSLDVSVKAQILTLLKNLQRDLGLSLLFISHDLAVLRSLAHRTYIMYLGKVMESGETAELFKNPRHPYTAALLSAALGLDPKKARERERILLKGDIPSPIDPPSGCRFHTRCPFAQEKCSTIEPVLEEDNGRFFACHFPIS